MGRLLHAEGGSGEGSGGARDEVGGREAEGGSAESGEAEGAAVMYAVIRSTMASHVSGVCSPFV